MTECILKVTAISMAGYCIRAIMIMDGLYTSIGALVGMLAIYSYSSI